ncbi:heavy metal transport/detoxification protein [Thalassoporum mexicanum PCC 7367]|uniref:heavy-metal-associated domain-containing protein n=1 Tax=Thalassoporum mexicanum TaxID=3457544 RepID=UPI00029F94D0|nr:heavy-metal-associated domain-containing protein [Pseudanabaena sp. PCC 7367]AFY69282.1 heavy metal transport/detoxification protein [Pseudanabaena sp. PCC 7367]
MNLNLKVPDMACSACAETITNAIVAIDSSAQITADLTTKEVSIETQHPEADIRTAIISAGYTVE